MGTGIRDWLLFAETVNGDAVEGLDPESGKVYWAVDVKPTFGMSIGHPWAGPPPERVSGC